MNDLCTSSSSSSSSSTSNRTKHDSLYPALDSLSSDANAARWLAPVLILVPLRLGLHELDVIYEDFLKEALKLPQTVGIIGGSPRHAVYILGYQDDGFIDMDPHFCQTTVNVLDETFDISVRWLQSMFESSHTSLCLSELFMFVSEETLCQKNGSELYIRVLLSRQSRFRNVLCSGE